MGFFLLGLPTFWTWLLFCASFFFFSCSVSSIVLSQSNTLCQYGIATDCNISIIYICRRFFTFFLKLVFVVVISSLRHHSHFFDWLTMSALFGMAWNWKFIEITMIEIVRYNCFCLLFVQYQKMLPLLLVYAY